MITKADIVAQIEAQTETETRIKKTNLTMTKININCIEIQAGQQPLIKIGE